MRKPHLLNEGVFGRQIQIRCQSIAGVLQTLFKIAPLGNLIRSVRLPTAGKGLCSARSLAAVASNSCTEHTVLVTIAVITVGTPWYFVRNGVKYLLALSNSPVFILVFYCFIQFCS